MFALVLASPEDRCNTLITLNDSERSMTMTSKIQTPADLTNTNRRAYVAAAREMMAREVLDRAERSGTPTPAMRFRLEMARAAYLNLRANGAVDEKWLRVMHGWARDAAKSHAAKMAA